MMVINYIHQKTVIQSNWIEIVFHEIGHKNMISLTWIEISFNVVELHFINIKYQVLF